MTETARPHLTRRRHQQALSRQRRRRRKRRLSRIRRVRMIRALRSLRFWARTGIALCMLLALAFWAKFAVVYHVPAYAQRGVLQDVDAYVAVKPWWFGPPVFDLSAYETADGPSSKLKPYDLLLAKLGRYSGILVEPQLVWADGR